MKKKFFLAFMMLIPSISFAALISESYCFTTGGKKPIELGMQTYFDTTTKWSTGFIKYKNSRQPISLVLKNIETEIIDKDRPYQTTTTWLEMSENAISGEYEMVSQGTGISSFVYTNFKRKKQYAFLLDTNVDSSKGCEGVAADTGAP